MNLTDETRTLLVAALEVSDPDEAKVIGQLMERLDQPLRLAIAGRVKAGKSTLLNALVGDAVAPTDAAECTKVITWYGDGAYYRAWLHPREGTERRSLRFTRDLDNAHIDLDGTAPGDIDHLEVEFPSQHLHGLTIIDTPGTTSISEQTSERTHDFLLSDSAGGNVDIVIYLMRHLHDADVDFLESFAGEGDQLGHPTMAIGVLSRADEVGGGRSDAMEIAAGIAEATRGDVRLRSRVQTVIPIAGLLAFSATTIRQAEFDAMRALATAPVEEFDEAISSVDAFVSDEHLVSIPSAERRSLLLRFGVHGIRHAVGLLHHDRVQTPDQMMEALVHHSGLERLRGLVKTLFGERQSVLKAELALNAVHEMCRRHDGPEAAHLRAEVERIRLGAHEITELETLNELRIDPPGDLDPVKRAEAERLLGATGTSFTQRLGIDSDHDLERTRQTTLSLIEQWRSASNQILGSKELRALASVVVASLERLYSQQFTRAD